MELSLEPFRAAGAAAPRSFVPRRDPFLFEDVEVPLAGRFGRATRASAAGNRSGPVVVVLGGISGNRFVARGADGGPGWWQGLAGPGRAIDPARHLIVGLDFAADESGAAAPTTLDQARVLAAALDRLLEHLERRRRVANMGPMHELNQVVRHRNECISRCAVMVNTG